MKEVKEKPSASIIAKKEKVNISGLKKTSKIPDILTIKESLSKKENEKKDDQINIGTDPVSVEQLKSAWLDFANELKKAGRDREYNTLNQEVGFNEDLSINLTLPNSFQTKTIEDLQLELLTHLRRTLNNSKIRLKTEVEKIENKKLIYTNSEKFEFLSEKYPNLKDLKARLDLDTDF